MSVSLECESGESIVCLQEFHACPDGEAFSWPESRKFRIGERLSFVAGRRNKAFAGRPNEWQVVFEADDGRNYAAAQTFFVTEETWRGLKKFFARRLLHEPARGRQGKRR